MDAIVCSLCGLAVDHENVTCVQCSRSFHVSCVEEDETVWGSEWQCESCRAAPTAATRSGAIARSDATPAGPSRRESRAEPTTPRRHDAPSERERLSSWARHAPPAQEQPARPVESAENRQDEPQSETERNLRAQVDAMMTIMARFCAQSGSTPLRQPHPSSTAYDQLDTHELSRSQMSARHAVARELPPFSGKIEDWPLFFDTYEETTRLCGFSASENVLRLRQALSGRALKAVQCRLRRAEDLPEALTTLKEMYGRPEFLVDTLLAQVRRTPAPREDRLETLVDFALAVEEICATVRSHDRDHRFDGPVLRELVDLLPWAIKIDWGRHCLNIQSKTLQEFGSFMRTLKNALLHVVNPASTSDGKRSSRHVNIHTTANPVQQAPRAAIPCPCDGGCSTLADCWRFWQMNTPQRWDYAKANNLCKSCLRPHRGACRDTKQCGRDGCAAKHHRSLHSDRVNSPPRSTNSPPNSSSRPPTESTATAPREPRNRPESPSSEYTNHHSAGAPEVLLRYVPVKLYGRGKCVETLACLDEGSSVTLMEHELVAELGLNGTAKPLCLSWTGGQTRDEKNSVEINVAISGVGSSVQHPLSSVRTVENLSLPVQSVRIPELVERYGHLRRTPVRSYESTAPQLLIGIDNYRLSCPLRTVEGAPYEPVATRTRLGWVVSGVCGARGDKVNSTLVSHHALLGTCHDVEQRVNEAMKGCFALDDARPSRVLRSRADELALEQLRAHTRLVNGRYETGLLWRVDDPTLPPNRTMALRRLDCLERRRHRDETLRDAMNRVMHDYLSKGYIRKISNQEEKRETVALHDKREPLFDVERFSRWWRLIRAAAFVRRFIHSARHRSLRRIGPFQPLEIHLAEGDVVADAQRQAFPTEYRLLATSPKTPGMPTKSALHQRSPYLDDDGIIRLRGRIDACAQAPHDAKRPIILPKSAKVTDLVVDHYHRKHKHANHQTVMNEIRQRYDIPALRAACHRVRNHCSYCKIRRAIPQPPPMGDLPGGRLSPYARPLTFVRIDFFGPYLVAVGRRTEKRWGVLITCMTTRAMHIEVAHALTTSACILAIHNFVGRRGTPNEIFSDNGTNFVGANRELQEAWDNVSNDALIEGSGLPYSTWHFIPPSAPHFGGAWERLVQSIKRTLAVIQLTNRPSDAVLTNWLIEVESIVNSRPLTDVPVDREEDAPLTPNHFLLGSSAGVKPLLPLDDRPSTVRNSWKSSQKHADAFWKKWISTYLPTLTRRTKWHQPSRNLKEGDLAVVVDAALPRGCWPVGKIIQVIPSTDRTVKRVLLRTARGKTLERPTIKVAALDIVQNNSDDSQDVTRGPVSVKRTAANSPPA